MRRRADQRRRERRPGARSGGPTGAPRQNRGRSEAEGLAQIGRRSAGLLRRRGRSSTIFPRRSIFIPAAIKTKKRLQTESGRAARQSQRPQRRQGISQGARGRRNPANTIAAIQDSLRKLDSAHRSSRADARTPLPASGLLETACPSSAVEPCCERRSREDEAMLRRRGRARRKRPRLSAVHRMQRRDLHGRAGGTACDPGVGKDLQRMIEQPTAGRGGLLDTHPVCRRPDERRHHEGGAAGRYGQNQGRL